jgi:hypothetical protein
MLPPLVTVLFDALRESLDQLRSQVSDVRYGPSCLILFDFKGVTYAAPEPKDVMPVGYGEASKSWALRQILDGTAQPFTPSQETTP